MYQQIALALLNIRIFLAVFFTAGVLAASSAIVTAAGSGTVLDSQKHPTVNLPRTDTSDTSNAVTAATIRLSEDLQLVTISVGRAFYNGCHSFTTASVNLGKSVAHAGTSAVASIWHGVSFVGQKIGSGVMYTVGVPGKAVSSISQAPAVSGFIRPADNIEAPAISSQTSTEILAQYNEKQREHFTKLIAEQEAANRNLGGTTVVGNQTHGGYPDKWQNARQDSMIDDWGMYNRECVSYAAWKVHQTFGSMPYWGGIGNANQWVANARAAGIPTGKTPRVNSVAISMQGYYGHAMWVEKVDGNRIYVSQYNYDLRGHYSEMWLDGRSLTYIYFE